MFEEMLGAFLAPYGSDFCVLKGWGGCRGIHMFALRRWGDVDG